MVAVISVDAYPFFAFSDLTCHLEDDSIDSRNFSMRGYLISITHMHGLEVYVKEGLPFARDLSIENSADSYLFFRLALLHSVSH